MGGGVIIKPVLDAFGVMDVAAISFLSGCTVLSMSAYSIVKNKMSGKLEVEYPITLPLALGAAVGGCLGKWLFSFILSISSDMNKAGLIQSSSLLLITIVTAIYTIKKDKIKTHHVRNSFVIAVIGLLLGILSSFLGIGGGPINLVILFFFFSMRTKLAAVNSLYTIVFSQMAGLMANLLTGNVPEFHWKILLLMIAGGILGGICGRGIDKKIPEKAVDKLFFIAMFIIIIINGNNVYKFML